MIAPVENGIDVRQISRTGSTLEIHYEDYENLLNKSEEGATVEDTLGNYIEKSFDEYSADMIVVDKHGFVKKKLLEEGGGDVVDENCTVGLAYSGYFEKEKKPFDVRPPIKPMDVNMTENCLLCGLQQAVLTMKVGELSMFILSYKVMYGEMGNPPKVKPKADCLFFIKLMRSKLTPEIMDSADEPSVFKKMMKECKILFKNGSSFYNSSNIPMAIRCFNRAVNIMHHTRLADEEEEKQQEQFLLKLYLNLATCYNNSKNPRRACCMCNEINRLQTIWRNGKALYQNAKALRMLGEFKGAEKKLKRAMQLCPDKQEFEEEMNKIRDAVKAYEHSRLIASRILEQRPNSQHVSEGFKVEVDNLIKKFAQDTEICKIALPRKLTSAELKYLEDAAKKFQISCIVKKDISLDKMPAANATSSVFED